MASPQAGAKPQQLKLYKKAGHVEMACFFIQVATA